MSVHLPMPSYLTSYSPARSKQFGNSLSVSFQLLLGWSL
jgi:hypothetical protein